MNRLLILFVPLVCGLFNAATLAMENFPNQGGKPYTPWLEALQKNPDSVSISHVPKFYLSIAFNKNKISRALDEKEIKLFIAELEKQNTENARQIVNYLQQLLTAK